MTSTKTEDIVVNIEKVDKLCQMRTNTGEQSLLKQGELPGTDGKVKMWVDGKSIATILSLGILAKTYRITYNNYVENAFTMYTEVGPVKFYRR